MSARTTLTLDDDVADRLAREVRATGRPLRLVVNAALRRGLDPASETASPFRTRSAPMGRRPEFDEASVQDLLDRLEGHMRR